MPHGLAIANQCASVKELTALVAVRLDVSWISKV